MQKYFVDLWNGDKSLLQTFWIWNVLAYGVINSLSGYATMKLSGYASNEYVTAENLKILSWAIVLPQIIYFIFAAKCLWACGKKNHQNAFGWGKIWFPLIIIYIVFNILNLSRILLVQGYI